MFKSGFAAVIGRPNVGKSTLLNNLIGQKLLIVSDKPQTTRNRIHCILNTEQAQVVFLDTPGIHRPRHRLGDFMVKTAMQTMKGVDLLLFMVEGNLPPGPGDKYILRMLEEVDTPVFLLINKIDIAGPEQEALKDEYKKLYPFTETLEVSALTGVNLELLTENILAQLPEGPQYYPEDMATDQPERFVVAELIREKLLHLTREEVPHSTAVIIEEMAKRDSSELVDIRAVIYVERESQKGIVIGKKGAILKEVGSLARQEIEILLGSPVFLDLWVKVKKDWRNQESYLREFGYRED